MAKGQRGYSFVLIALAMALAMSALVAAGQAPARADWSPPSFVRSMGGIGRAGVYAWGLAHNPVTDEIIVSDYLNFRVRRYSTDGRHLGDLEERPGEPWSVATDPNSGDIYVMNNWDNRLERYDPAGNHIRSIGVSGGWNAWIDVDHRGWIWIIRGGPQSSNFRLDYYNSSGSKLGEWSINPPAPLEPTMFGIEVAGDGRVFLSDSNNGLIHVYGANGSYETSFGHGHLTGDDVRGVTLDEANGWLYTSDASANSVVKFTMDGDFVDSFGGIGDAPGQFNGPRQLSVDSDGDIWVADFGNYRFQEFAPDGTHLGTYPDPPQTPPAGHLAHAADSVVDPATGDVWVADTYNQRFHRLAADGTPTGLWGKRGGDEYGMNYPSTIGFDPVLRRVWIGMEEGRHLKVYDDQANYLFIVGDQTKTPENSGYLRNVTDIDFDGDRAFISDEQDDKIKVIDAGSGEELYEIDAYGGGGWSGNHGLAINPANGDLFIANYSLDRVNVYSQSGSFKYSFGSSGSGEGQFRSPRDVAIIDGVAYVSDAQLSRIQAFELDGTYLGQWGGWGSGPYQFRNPMGLDSDADGLLYVTDVENGRITVFDPSIPKPAFQWGPPQVSIASPIDGQLVTGGELFISGTASDDDGIANIEISVQDTATGLWWNGAVAAWEPDPYPNLGLWMASTAPATAASFNWFFPAIDEGRTFNIEVLARDRHGTASSADAVTVTIADGAIPDAEDPVIIIDRPVADEVFDAAVGVRFEGSATDDVAVDSVDIAIQDLTTSKWLQSDGTWGGFGWVPSDFIGSGTPAVDWSYDWASPGIGDYGFYSRVIDIAGKLINGPYTDFRVVDSAGDVNPPDGTAATPLPDAVVLLGPIDFAGTASDDRAVATVQVALKNLDTQEWLRHDGSWGGFRWHTTDLGDPGAPSTNWAWSYTPTEVGSYGLLVRAKDFAGNIDPSRPWVPISVIPIDGDTDPPDSTVTTPRRNELLASGEMQVAGTATDNVGVDRVQVAVKNKDTGQWLRKDGSWGAFQWHKTSLDSSGAPVTDWSYSITIDDPGSYHVLVRARDTSANLDPTKPKVPFQVG